MMTSAEGGHRIAYDPRDLQDEGETAEHPRLTLMEECLLLGLKDKQGYLSFWNDNISYTLRGCILIELALRRRIIVSRDTSALHRPKGVYVAPVQDRLIEVIDGKMTGEVLLDEALKMMKTSERMSAAQWVDLLSGETWNVTKIGYQLKQVRERLAKGLVDKGVLRTEKRNFLLFDMATHPVADSSAKDSVLRRVLSLLTSSNSTVHAQTLYREERKPIIFATARALCLLCCSFSANVLENALTHLSYDAREAAFQKADDILTEFAQWPMAPSSAVRSKTAAQRIGEGSIVSSHAEAPAGASILELGKAIRAEIGTDQTVACAFEAIAGVLYTLSRMDSLL
jgi:Golgi phosphoprotein 3